MKVELIKQTFNDCSGYKYKPLEWCCEKLKNNYIINLVDKYTDDNNLDEHENVIPSIAIKETEIFHDWEDEWEENKYYKIDYCPFCGKPIEISIVGKEDVSDFYVRLVKQREKVWKKCCKIDSKKKSEELRKAAYELDKQINWFHTLLEYEDIKEKIKILKTY